MARTEERERRALALLSSVPLAAQLLFHLWEQWPIFGGRYAYIDRLASTSTGVATSLEAALFVLPMLAWAILLGRALARGERIPGQARPGDPALSRLLGGVIRVVSPVAALTLLTHAIALWGARVLGGEPPIASYDLARTLLGQPLWLSLHGVLVCSVTWHLAACLPDGLEAAGLVGADGRRSAFTVTAVFGACLFVLYAQLTGWVATGLGTFWPVRVVSETIVSP